MLPEQALSRTIREHFSLSANRDGGASELFRILDLTVDPPITLA